MYKLLQSGTYSAVWSKNYKISVRNVEKPIEISGNNVYNINNHHP